MKKRIIYSIVFVVTGITLFLSSATFDVAAFAETKQLDSGTTWVIDKTLRLTDLTIRDGVVVIAPEGYSLSMTVDTVQQDILPGTYKGDIVISVTEDNPVEYQDNMTYHFRQALYVDTTGVVEDKSVTSAVRGGQVTDTGAKNITIASEGENFNGIFATGGGTYTVEDAKIDFTGNGGNDFVGYGAAVMSAGDGTRFILDNADIITRGVVRTAVIASGGNLIVKNSRIETHDGIVTDEYLSTVKAFMVEGPWSLGISGSVRATSIIGEGATATYINTDIASEGWGVLSTDMCRNASLNAINCRIAITGKDGYGTFIEPSAAGSFYGCDFSAPDYGAIISGIITFGASSMEKVSELNNDLNLGLSKEALKNIVEKQTIVNSGRFGILFSKASGIANITDGTIFNTKKAVFLVQGAAAEINVDGSDGVQLNSGNAIITQVMDRDRVSGRRDPDTGRIIREPYYTEPYTAYADIVKDTSHDITAFDSSDIIGNYRNITLKGDFYNGRTGIEGRDEYPSSNLVLNFNNAQITGIISSTFARHAKNSFGKTDYKLIGEVSNTPCPAINNGVIVFLDADSVWTVTGTSYLTKLSLAKGATLTAPAGYNAILTLDGVKKEIKDGEYQGDIVVSIIKI